MIRSFAVACAAVVTFWAHGHANVIVNGDFELGNVGFSSDFSLGFLNSSAGTYLITDNPINLNSAAVSYGDNTTGSGNMLAANGTVDSTSAVWRQTVSVLPNRVYDFEVWLSTWFGNPVNLDVFFGDVRVGDFASPTATGVWRRHAAVWSSGDLTSITINIINLSTEFNGNDFAIDDISLVARPSNAVPLPPAGLLLLGALGSLLAYRGHR